MIETSDTGKENKDSMPDEESFDLVIGMLLQKKETETAFKYIDLNLKFGYSMSLDVFSNCVSRLMESGSLDTLVSLIERCKVHVHVMKPSVSDIFMPSYCFIS